MLDATLNTSHLWATVRTTTIQRAPTRHGPSLIVPQLYLSDYFSANDEAQLSKLGITHVISVMEYDVQIPDIIQEGNRIHIRIPDKPDADILTHLERTTEFIRLALMNARNNVLVHCYQGISRSATVVCAYLVATTGMRAIDSIAFVQSKRRIVCPNSGFRQQLEMYSNFSAFMNPAKTRASSGALPGKTRRPSIDRAEGGGVMSAYMGLPSRRS
ncbi:hypothetical protein AAF712_005799 [Marasmius tenuissimus]|uniref:Protein-tyrosine-phosphatase n=1 Tax=Marasmius tenuissimus TaxID=585030 RepID=A0ABR3A1P4_9AGAR|nr:hypothetical protein PM082_010873 [Marasmius tenuissimus]